ncbi:MAG TPA: ATPase [Chloroflexota bacterium]|nr:ATPase [Chloroflexota bacterium]
MSSTREGISMDILMLVDRLEAVINGGWRPPLSEKVMIDEREALDVLDLMRTAIPEEIKQSRRVNQDRERLIAEAQADANRLLTQAEERLNALVSDDTITQAAEERAEEIEREAYSHAEEIRQGADRYAYDVLQQLDGRIDRIRTEVRNGLRALAPRRTDEADRGIEELELAQVEE